MIVKLGNMGISVQPSGATAPPLVPKTVMIKACTKWLQDHPVYKKLSIWDPKGVCHKLYDHLKLTYPGNGEDEFVTSVGHASAKSGNY